MFRKQNSEKSIHNKKQTGIKAQTMSVGKTTEGFNCGGVCKLLNVSLEVWMQVFESWRTGGEEVKERTNWFSSTVMGCTSHSRVVTLQPYYIFHVRAKCTHFAKEIKYLCLCKKCSIIFGYFLWFSLPHYQVCALKMNKKCAAGCEWVIKWVL